MKAVEQLVIREKADTQGLVGKTFMDGLVDGGKRYVVSPILKNGPDKIGRASCRERVSVLV